ncbi:MAG TPA: flagellar assembly protein FliX [Xanthobacteraceae bacterium]|nr:flagellar assembly protein FliX [Xanthobacteraceae bacterium]
MRVHAAGNLALAAPAGAPRRAPGGAFSLGAGEEPRSPVQSTGPRAVAGIEALVALQGLEDAGERRRRAVGKGRRALDILDELKIGLLAGTLDAGALRRLAAVSESLTEDCGDAGLNAVMAEIELRTAVELAKLSKR